MYWQLWPFTYLFSISGITWTDTTNKAAFRWEHEAAFEDMDGTLTGTRGAKVVPSNPTLDLSVCTEEDGWSIGNPRGSICDTDKPFHRYAWNNVSRLCVADLFTNILLIVDLY